MTEQLTFCQKFNQAEKFVGQERVGSGTCKSVADLIYKKSLERQQGSE